MTDPLISNNRVTGALLAAAVGDALGWPQEDRSQIIGGNAARNVPAEPRFRAWERNGGTQYARYRDPVRPGEYSDDTQLLLAVARSCLVGDRWYDWLTEVELPVWPTFERGGGGAVLAAARAWSERRPPWIAKGSRDEDKVGRYFNAGANGVAMRVAPHAILTALKSPEELMLRVVRDGLATHGHPRALVGACLHVLALRYAVREEGTLGYGELLHTVARDSIWRVPDFLTQSVDDEWRANHRRHTQYRQVADHWQDVVREVDDLLAIAADELSRGSTGNDNRALEALGCFDKSRNGAGTVSAVSAIYVASRTAARPMSGLLRTGFLAKADTDTLCSMTGSLLGAVHGTEWLGELARSVQDSIYITHLATALNDASNGYASPMGNPLGRVATTASQLRHWSDDLLAHGASDFAPDGRPWRVRDVVELPTKSRSVVTRAVGVTHDGQRLIHDRVSKVPFALARRPSDQEVPSGRTAEQQPAHVATEPRISTVEIPVADLGESARFFTDVLGFKVETKAERVVIGGALVLFQGKPDDHALDRVGAVISVHVGCDLDLIAARAEKYPKVRVAWSADGRSLWVKEPGQNTLRIASASGTAPGTPASYEQPLPLGDLSEGRPRGGSHGETHEQAALFDADPTGPVD